MVVTPHDHGGDVHLSDYPGLVFRVVWAHPLDPAGQLAHVELAFTDGPLAGLKVTGFSVWERRTSNARRNVTFPARTYHVHGERRSFALVRVDDHNFHQAPTDAHERLRAAVVAATEVIENLHAPTA